MSAILVWMFSSLAFAAGPGGPTCVPKPVLTLEKTIPLPNNINYFIRPSTTWEMVYSSSDKNHMINVKTGGIKTLPGSKDPTLSPDGKLLILPDQTGHYDYEKGGFRPRRPGEPAPQYSLIYGKIQKCGPDSSCGLAK